MLSPVTKVITDHSTDQSFEFTFHCDICRKAWRSPRFGFSSKAEKMDKSVLALIWQAEHDAAYERANQEAIHNFNRCPQCGKFVCNECFILDAGPDGGDLCIDCLDDKQD